MKNKLVNLLKKRSELDKVKLYYEYNKTMTQARKESKERTA